MLRVGPVGAEVGCAIGASVAGPRASVCVRVSCGELEGTSRVVDVGSGVLSDRGMAGLFILTASAAPAVV